MNGNVLSELEFEQINEVPQTERTSNSTNSRAEDDAKRLRKLLKLYFYSAFKWKDNACSLHVIYCLIFLIQIGKVTLITLQLLHVGNYRSHFSSNVNIGYLTLKHLLIKDWSATWETLPYPPSTGDFAVYTIDDLENDINFAVSGYYNVEHEATGYFVRIGDDNMAVTLKYYDFPRLGDEIEWFETTFTTEMGLSKTVVGNETLYSYNVTKELEYLNISQLIKRMSSAILHFTIHSMRSHENSGSATCMQIEGKKTKRFMSQYFAMYYGTDSDKEKNWPCSEYFRFFKFWDILVIFSDILTIYGTVKLRREAQILKSLDCVAVLLGIGCIFAWFSLLRFFKFTFKFHLLFSTIHRALWDVLAYLVCVVVLFVGFWVCGYIVMGPYHVKFSTPERAAETLFTMINGDEIYATFAILEEQKTGSKGVYLFSRFYIGTFVGIFTIVVINLLIALFMNAYETIQEYKKGNTDDSKLNALEKALRQYLTSNNGIDNQPENDFFKHFYQFLISTNDNSDKAKDLRSELLKLVKVSDGKIEPARRRTLKAFMEEGTQEECCCILGSFPLQKKVERET